MFFRREGSTIIEGKGIIRWSSWEALRPQRTYPFNCMKTRRDDTIYEPWNRLSVDTQ
jgi:hypothetical protein